MDEEEEAELYGHEPELRRSKQNSYLQEKCVGSACLCSCACMLTLSVCDS